MSHGRLRFASLWLSQTSRALGDNCLRMFVLLQIVAGGGQKEIEAAWYQVAVFFILPFIVLAPINGSISNSLPKRWVLTGSAAFGLAVAVLLGAVLDARVTPVGWCVGLLLVMIGGAIYNPTRYALLPAIAKDIHIPLPRINGWIEMGGAAAVVVGLLLGVELAGHFWLDYLPAAVAATAGLYLLAVVTAIPVHFVTDVSRPEPPAQAVLGFFRDCGRVFRDAEARDSLLGLAGFLALVLAGSGAVLAYHGALDLNQRSDLVWALVCVSVGAAAGSLLAGLQGHPRRSLGLVPCGATGLLLALVWAAGSSGLEWPCILLGVMAGLVNVPLRATFQAAVPADARGNSMAVLNTVYYTLAVLLSALLYALVHGVGLTKTGQLWLLASLAGVGAGLAWRAYYRDSIELFLEIILLPFYRIRGFGPGLDKFPRRGPVLVVANHAAWFDPLWLAKIVPRRVFPMMTSMFFDLPVLHWLMVNVVHAIRVPAIYMRRDAPELKDAIAALDNEGCVLIFPEGMLRRRDDTLLRRFGQGVWHILRQRPQTPVVVCWIEGGWGSFTSFKNGPPTRNKRIDIRRPIDIGMSEPCLIEPEYLESLQATRVHLMERCLEARRHLGLDPRTREMLGLAEKEEESELEQHE